MAQWLAILLPGGGYGPLGAVLRLPRLVLEAAGANVVVVDYPARRPSEEWLTELVQSVSRQVAQAVDEVGARRVTFVAKSLGTVALADLDPAAARGAKTEAIWLTPLFGEKTVRDGAIRQGWRSLLVAGGADSAHDPGAHQAVLEALAADSLILADADHLLEVAGDAAATVDHLRELVDAVTRFSVRQ